MMREIRLHGRFGQPVGALATALARHAMSQGRHAQVFNAFAAFRPGGPMHAIVRVADAPIRERSANTTAPDIVIVLDNSLFAAVDVTKGLKPGGTVMALGVDAGVLGTKGAACAFTPLDPFIAGSGLKEIGAGLIASLTPLEVW